MAALIRQTILLILLLLVGVSRTRHISYYDNASPERPMVTAAQERRICAELCMAGLGGEPCGGGCVDVIPQGLVAAAASSSSPSPDLPECAREDACPVLCANRLGYPLCNCSYDAHPVPFFKPDFLQVCVHFCEHYDYRIYGCDTCEVYKNMTAAGGAPHHGLQAVSRYVWQEWCVQVCQEGDGGSACFCDLLPMKYLP